MPCGTISGCHRVLRNPRALLQFLALFTALGFDRSLHFIGFGVKEAIAIRVFLAIHWIFISLSLLL